MLVNVEGSEKPEVARVDKIKRKNKKTDFDITWYIRPEYPKCGRLVFQGKDELLSSNWRATISADCLIDKCTVHTFGEYEKLEEAGPNDFFSRSKYDHINEAYDPDESLPVYDKRFFLLHCSHNLCTFFNNLRHCTC